MTLQLISSLSASLLCPQVIPLDLLAVHVLEVKRQLSWALSLGPHSTQVRPRKSPCFVCRDTASQMDSPLLSTYIEGTALSRLSPASLLPSI
jgi:hypothetical protein